MEDRERPPRSGDGKPRRRRKDPTRLLKFLREARLHGPRDWATNIDDYIYRGKRADIIEGEDAGEQTE